jgi:hypothetical protein
MPLKELLDEVDAEGIRPNPRYQRSGGIWPARAKSFLVETVLLEMPIPRVLLHRIDTPLPPHHTDIIDGQQRCTILADYRNDRFALTADVDDERLYGKKFSDLSPSMRTRFENYSVPIDTYDDVDHRQIRQVFRRLNYYTAPLNAAEQRHAQFYGALSRFVEEEAQAWLPTLVRLGVLTKTQTTRKAHEQLLAEIVDAMLKGVSTPTAKSLRTTYKDNERQFPSIADFRSRLAQARLRMDGWTFLRSTRLRKHYQIFAMVLAVMHAQRDLLSIREHLGRSHPLRPDDEIRERLRPLDLAIRKKVERGRYAPFWRSSHEKTNVRENRLNRCRYFYSALTRSP